MRTAALTLLLLASAAVPARAQDAPSYHALLARAQAGDTTVSFTALRKAWAASPEYAPYGSDADETADSMRAALARRDWPRAVREADSVLAVKWLDVRTHVLKAYAAGQMGDSAAASRERWAAARIVRSVAESGEGTQESPFVVVTVAEEYAFLSIFGYDPAGQGLGQCGRHLCDVMQAVSQDTHEKRTFYFDISIPTGYLQRSVRAGSPKP